MRPMESSGANKEPRASATPATEASAELFGPEAPPLLFEDADSAPELRPLGTLPTADALAILEKEALPALVRLIATGGPVQFNDEIVDSPTLQARIDDLAAAIDPVARPQFGLLPSLIEKSVALARAILRRVRAPAASGS